MDGDGDLDGSASLLSVLSELRVGGERVEAGHQGLEVLEEVGEWGVA